MHSTTYPPQKQHPHLGAAINQPAHHAANPPDNKASHAPAQRLHHMAKTGQQGAAIHHVDQKEAA